MAVTIQDNFNTAAAKPIDNRYGPYNSDAAAASAIPQIYRYKGLTVGVLTSGVVEEYWWNNVLTGNPIKKSAVGNLTGVTQGTGIIVDNTNPQIPDISVDTSYVQVVSNLSTDVPTDGTSDVKYPSVKAVKDYADGLVVGLLNDRGNYAASNVSPGPYPSTGGSGTAGAILKGDIWFISVVGTGYLGTTPVVTGSSVRALVNSPGVSTPADWDILDVGLGFTPENVTNKVSTGANVNADPTSTSKYPSVNALVEYVTNYSPTPTTPDLQTVTGAGYTTSDPIQASSIGFTDPTFSNYATFYCETVGLGSRIRLDDSFASPRLSLDTAGTDLTVWTTSGTVNSILDFASVTSTQTFTFPNATGTIALTSDLSSYVPYTNATLDINIGDHNIIAQKSLLGGTISAGFGIFSSNPVVYVDDTSTSSQGFLLIYNNVGTLALRNSTNIAYLQCTNISSPDKILELPDVTGTLVATVATSAGNLSTGTDGKVTIPDASAITTGLITTGTQTIAGAKTFNGQMVVNADIIGNSNVSGSSIIGSSFYGPLAGGTNINAPVLNIYGARGTGSGTGGDINIATSNTGSSGSTAQAVSTKVTIKGTTGNVGIGTSSPTYKLDINGNLRTSSGYGFSCGGGISMDGVGATLFFNNTSAPSSAPSGYDAIHSGGSLVTAEYNGLYLRKQNSGYNYTLLEFPATSTVGILGPTRYRFANMGINSNGAVLAITDSNVSAANNYVLKAVNNTGEMGKSQIFDNGTSVGINTATPNASAILELSSTTQGFLPPRMTSLQRGNILSPAVGLMVYQTDDDLDAGKPKGVYVYDGTTWRRLNWT